MPRRMVGLESSQQGDPLSRWPAIIARPVIAAHTLLAGKDAKQTSALAACKQVRRRCRGSGVFIWLPGGLMWQPVILPILWRNVIEGVILRVEGR